MSAFYGNIKVKTSEGCYFFDRLRDAAIEPISGDVLSVFEFNHTLKRYRPTSSGRAWLREKLGQPVEESPAQDAETNVYVQAFRDMMKAADDLGYTAEEKREAEKRKGFEIG